MTDRGPLPPIDFAALAAALLDRARTLVPMWLPGGVIRGHEYVCGSLSGGEGNSCSINLATGKWADFAGDAADKGNDLISLYAAIHGLDQGKAAVEVARAESLEDVARVQRSADAAPARPPRPPDPVKASSHSSSNDEGWRTLTPVPPSAPAPTFKHQYRQAADILHKAEYRMGGQLLGYVVRFRTSDGGKETLPYTWCTSQRDGANRWHWRQWDVPRPLYVPLGTMPQGRTVVLVEGEIKAEVLQQLLEAGAPGVYLVVSWPGGSKAWKKAMWDWLAGCNVLLWPDCDGKRVQLNKAEREACADDMARAVALQAKPLLPPEKQPGMAAMLGIGHMLTEWKQCTVQLLPIPAPGEVVDGWDCKDAIATDGWDFARVQAFFASAGPLPPDPAESEATGPTDGAGGADSTGGKGGGGSKKPPSGGAGGRADPEGDAELDPEDEFAELLEYMCSQAKCKPHELGVTRKLIIAALRKSALLRDCLGYNEMISGPCTQVPWPWRSKAGPLEEGDDLALGDWLSTHYKLKAASRAALAEAIETVADQRRYHPIRDYLKALKWDEKPRRDKWLLHVLGKDPATMPPRLVRYYELVGRFILGGLVARAMEPGCKFDYSPVLEGITGMGKSTMIEILVGKAHFSDTHFDIGAGKDGMEQIAGLWGYELGEMTAFRRADSEQVKQFFSSKEDRYRGAYGRYVRAHPRQLVIFCSTNKRRYLYDLTGNRRFWPLWIDKPVNLAWLAKYRDQLFAEAYAAHLAGERYFPSREEEEEFFVPEQRKRLVHTAVHAKLFELLTREGANSGEGKATVDLTVDTKFITIDRLVSVLGADAAKSTNMLEGQINSWMDAHGWTYGREGGGQRRYGFKQPKVWPPVIEDDDADERPPADETPPGAGGDTNGSPDDVPF